MSSIFFRGTVTVKWSKKSSSTTDSDQWPKNIPKPNQVEILIGHTGKLAEILSSYLWIINYDGPDLWKYSRPVEQIDQEPFRVVHNENLFTY